MPISFTCPHCGKHTEVAEQYAGQTGPCAGCGATITVPGTRAPGAEAPFAAPKTSSTATTTIVVLAVALVGMVMCGGILIALLLPAVQAAREAARRSQCSNNLKQIGLALHAYHDAYQTLPPAYIADADGQPMHSWRVLILPFMERKDLYDRYDFSEAWDGPNNQQLASLMPSAYACPSDPTAAISGITSYAVVVGPGTLFDGPDGHRFSEIVDGTSNTIAVVEAGQASLNWMEPEDLDLTQMAAIINGGPGEISSNHPGGAQVLFADGSVRMLNGTMSTVVLQSLLSRAGGETVGGF